MALNKTANAETWQMLKELYYLDFQFDDIENRDVFVYVPVAGADITEKRSRMYFLKEEYVGKTSLLGGLTEMGEILLIVGPHTLSDQAVADGLWEEWGA